MRRFFTVLALFMALALGGGLAAVGSAGLPRLQIATPFVVLGTNAIFTITGEPGASYTLLLSRQPAEVPAGPLGTLFLKQGTATSIAEGTLSGAGSALAQLPIPDTPAMNGTVFYAQALVTAGSASRLTNAVPFRTQAQPPAGGRAPRALAVTPDGTKAYTANQLDGTVSVVDLATQARLADLPVGPSATAIPYRPLDIAIDPEGRHVFVANVASGTLTVIDVATDSVAGQIPVSKGCRRIAFRFVGTARRIYVTNDVLNAILVIDETTPGVFVARAPIPLLGRGPGPIALLVDGRLVVGHRVTLELELVDPAAPPGGTTVGRVALGTQPLDVVVSEGEALVPTFKVTPAGAQNGFNQLLRVDLSNLQVTGALFTNAGTDYNAAAVSGSTIALAGSGSGTAVIGDLATGALLDTVDLVPGGIDPPGTPQDIAFGPPAGAPTRAYVVDQFRETIRYVALSAGPPFAIGPEIPLAYSGVPRVPLTGDLSDSESGDYLMRSGHFFNATAANPNSVTCQTCHTDGASDNVKRLNDREPLPLFNLGSTAPYLWQGTSTDLLGLIRNAFTNHNEIGGPIANDADLKMLSFFHAFMPPKSIHLLPGGALGADAQAGKALFEGAAQCTTCHAAPHFLPPPGQPRTIAAGVGTGLAPINVPALRAVWATPPYFHDGSAKRLQDVFTAKPGDIHNVLTTGFTAGQIRQLVAYLNTL